MQPIQDVMNTVTEHIAIRLSAAINNSGIKVYKVLLTGGGANNQFLLERVKEKIGAIEIDSIDEHIIDYKEAIIFALLAYLRLNNMNNTLASVTGARRDSCGGGIFGKLRIEN